MTNDEWRRTKRLAVTMQILYAKVVSSIVSCLRRSDGCIYTTHTTTTRTTRGRGLLRFHQQFPGLISVPLLRHTLCYDIQQAVRVGTCVMYICAVANRVCTRSHTVGKWHCSFPSLPSQLRENGQGPFILYLSVVFISCACNTKQKLIAMYGTVRPLPHPLAAPPRF